MELIKIRDVNGAWHTNDSVMCEFRVMQHGTEYVFRHPKDGTALSVIAGSRSDAIEKVPFLRGMSPDNQYRYCLASSRGVYSAACKIHRGQSDNYIYFGEEFDSVEDAQAYLDAYMEHL